MECLKVSPLSLTVPYLAFTPVLLIFTSYFLLGETLAGQGIAGVMLITLGGYFLQGGNAESQLPSGRCGPEPTFT
jgi:drug/metabolite transporter (DMT)-like permease